MNFQLHISVYTETLVAKGTTIFTANTDTKKEIQNINTISVWFKKRFRPFLVNLDMIYKAVMIPS